MCRRAIWCGTGSSGQGHNARTSQDLAAIRPGLVQRAAACVYVSFDSVGPLPKPSPAPLRKQELVMAIRDKGFPTPLAARTGATSSVKA